MMKDSKWIPDFLGGQNPNASIEGAFTPMVFIETPPGIHCYILFTYGYHVQNFVRHLFFVEVDNDWREMVLHHMCALALYPGFIFANIMGIGVVIAWLHDIADIVVGICRLLNRLGYEIPTLFFFVLMMAVWFYTRLMVLPLYIFTIITEVRFPNDLYHFQPIIWIELVFLSVM